MSTIFDLTKLGLEKGTYNISARAKASGYVDSDESNVVAYEVSHKLSGTWIFKDNLSLPQSAIKSNLSFTSNGELFAYGMILSATAIEFYYGIYTPLFVFQSGNWVNENYKTVKFEGEQKVSKEFYNCFIQNARKYKMITFTVDGVTYQAEEGMTWGEWLESEYNTLGATIDVNYTTTDPNTGDTVYAIICGSKSGNLRAIRSYDDTSGTKLMWTHFRINQDFDWLKYPYVYQFMQE
jgi:hypothetical protein